MSAYFVNFLLEKSLLFQYFQKVWFCECFYQSLHVNIAGNLLIPFSYLTQENITSWQAFWNLLNFLHDNMSFAVQNIKHSIVTLPVMREYLPHAYM